jgi:hypothetical protein
VVLLREAVNAAEHGGGGSCRAAWVVPSGKIPALVGGDFGSLQTSCCTRVGLNDADDCREGPRVQRLLLIAATCRLLLGLHCRDCGVRCSLP